MVDTPTTDAAAYQDLAELRDRVDYTGESLFQNNTQLRFDELLVRLERESRGIFETLWGDQTPASEDGRTDEITSVPEDAALTLVYPIQDVTQVEYKASLGDDFETLETDQYKHTKHNLILAEYWSDTVLRHRQRGNTLARNAERATWRDLATVLRVTYDRGFDTVPADIKSVQIVIINRMLRKLRQEQTVAAASPEEFAGVAADYDSIVTEEIRERISDVTTPGRATMTI
jgi:hypothetical protein